MAEIQDVEGARILITWNGHRLELRSTAPPDVVVSMLAGAQKLALDKWLSAGGGISGLGRKIGPG